jgi:NTP pyrophosphatase (non-canonical NTP hydrolase)
MKPKRRPKSQIGKLTDAVLKFRDARDWKQFHNSKDLSLAITIEAAELAELFLWKDAKKADKRALADELADVIVYCLLLAHENGIDIEKAIRSKLKQNAKKYPVAKFKGTARKYNEE